jgi:hypothetical protein
LDGEGINMAENIANIDIKQILAESKVELKKKITDQVLASIAQQIGWKIDEIVSNELNLLIKNEVKALIEKYKDDIIAHIKDGFAGIGKQFEQAIQAKMTENLKSSYNVSKIAEGLFR